MTETLDKSGLETAVLAELDQLYLEQLERLQKAGYPSESKPFVQIWPRKDDEDQRRPTWYSRAQHLLPRDGFDRMVFDLAERKLYIKHHSHARPLTWEDLP